MANKDSYEKITDNWTTGNKLFLLENSGCDDETYGLVELNCDEFALLAATINNLNKGSHYACQPTISYYETKWDYFREYTEKDEWGEDKIFFKGKPYTFKENFGIYNIDVNAPMRVYYETPTKDMPDLEIGF